MAETNPIPPILTEQAIKRFWSKVEKSDDLNACWLWQGSLFHRRRYGQFSVTHSRGCSAHRISFFLATGIWPRDYVLHKCDNPPYVNPDHLFEGTPLDNMRDKIQKGRARAAKGDANGARKHPEKMRRGENSPVAKLTENQVREIRAAYELKHTPYYKTAANYGVDAMLIWYIVKRRIWKHI